MLEATHIHAMAVHFPIALLMTGFVFFLISFLSNKDVWERAALYVTIVGTLGAIVSYISGDAAGEGMEQGELAKAMELHEHAAVITLVLAILTTVVLLFRLYKKQYSKILKLVALVLFAVTVGFTARTGYLGGQLVYKHAAGVQLALPRFFKPGQRLENLKPV